MVNLNGQVTDGEGDPLTYQWSVVSGPGNVFLGTPDAPAATATIYEAGTYVLELTVDDGLAQTTSQVTITVSEPVVDLDNDGIADSWETTYFPGQEATIDGTADSDGDLVLDYFEYLYESDPTDINDTGFWVIVPAPANRMAEWTLKEGFQPGAHYLIKMSTDLSTWNDLPLEHYTLHTTTNAGMTTVQLELTHNYPGHLFISLAQP